MKIFVGSYTNFSSLAHLPLGIEGKGIYVYSFDGKLLHNTKTIECVNPAVLKIKNNSLYAIQETLDIKGKINIYNLDNFKLTNALDCSGRSTCSLEINDEYSVATNYWNGTIDLFKNNRLIHTVNNSHRSSYRQVVSRQDHLDNRQVGPHPHCVRFWNNRFIISDLGENLISQYQVVNDRLVETYYTKFHTSCGPRHFVINNNIIYLINELTSSIYVMTIKDNKIKIIQMMSLVNDNPLKSHTNIHASEIKIFKNHIYASNRSENNIIIYKIKDDYTLEFIKNLDTRGKTPRHFDIFTSESHNDYLVVANQNSNNIVVFQITHTELEITSIDYVTQLDVPSPNYIKIV
jgi:6-phosphogluconolactonase